MPKNILRTNFLPCTKRRHDYDLQLVIASRSAKGLGRVKTVLLKVNSESQAQRKSQAAIAAIRRLVPMMFMTRVRL